MIAMWWIARAQLTAHCLAESDLIARAFECSAVKQLARLFRAAENTFRKSGVDVFRSGTDHRDLSVMDQHDPFAANAETNPRFIRSIRRGASPVLMT